MIEALRAANAGEDRPSEAGVEDTEQATGESVAPQDQPDDGESEPDDQGGNEVAAEVEFTEVEPKVQAEEAPTEKGRNPLYDALQVERKRRKSLSADVRERDDQIAQLHARIAQLEKAQMQAPSANVSTQSDDWLNQYVSEPDDGGDVDPRQNPVYQAVMRDIYQQGVMREVRTAVRMSEGGVDERAVLREMNNDPSLSAADAVALIKGREAEERERIRQEVRKEVEAEYAGQAKRKNPPRPRASGSPRVTTPTSAQKPNDQKFLTKGERLKAMADDLRRRVRG